MGMCGRESNQVVDSASTLRVETAQIKAGARAYGLLFHLVVGHVEAQCGVF